MVPAAKQTLQKLFLQPTQPPSGVNIQEMCHLQESKGNYLLRLL